MELTTFIIGAFSLLLGGGGLVALLKLRPETTNITVTSAEKVIILQSDELKRLYGRLNELEGRVSRYEEDENSLQRKIDSLTARLDNTEAELISVRRERDRLQARVIVLEKGAKNGTQKEK